jgi:hypothetical protein
MQQHQHDHAESEKDVDPGRQQLERLEETEDTRSGENEKTQQ